MANGVDEVTYDLETLLSSDGRDYLLRNNGDQVKISSLTGKIVGLYFSASWCPPCRRFTPLLAEIYQELAPKGDFELVFISSDRDEESFIAYFSKMPWLSIPFAHSDTLKRLKELFKVKGIPFLVVLDANRKVSTTDGVKLFTEHGVEAYPFSTEIINFLKEKEAEVKRNQTLSSILVSPSRNYVLSNDGNQVPVSELEGKVIGLYFSANHPECVGFTETLVEVYKKLKEKGEKFEIVLVPLDGEEEQFKRGFQSVPWLALPFSDEKKREKLVRYFELKTLPWLVIIGPDGKTLNFNATEIVEEHGVGAYPFTPEKLVELAEIEKAKLELQTLESLLVYGDRDFVIDKSGLEIPVSELIGKYILLYFSAHWCPPCREFLPKLIEVYHELKQKENELQIIFLSSDKDQSSFDEFFSGMPWLALPFGDQRKKFLTRKFKIESIPAIVAINESGRTITTQARKLITTHGADAYPFTEEHLQHLEEKANREKEGWVCEGDVCRKA